MLVSSAYMKVFEFVIAGGRSLIYMRNRGGPRHGPCGTPMVTSLAFESVPLTLQNCSRLDRYDLNQESSRLRIP